ncbi:MAG: Stp1/IreP family PP2C-type Ser/Thr phosphatase [Deltaproteobacteria bacterium]|nr:Stp1/IreP family PP2C-type Ser/Thr phosphatase [Deltaproteobacteria bacterium]
MNYEYFALSETGKVRSHNEDCYLCSRELGLFLVADGMGGHAGGETASRLAVSCIEEYVIRSRRESAPQEPENQMGWTPEQVRLFSAVSLANRRILETADVQPEIKGMGTTLTGVLFEEDHFAVVNVGDSRLYRIREGRIEQLTEDHTLVGEWARMGRMNPQEARKHPQRHILTSVLGIERHPRIDISKTALEPGDLYLICSDGLHGMIDDREILETIEKKREVSLSEVGSSLVSKANRAGGSDNITVLLLAF